MFLTVAGVPFPTRPSATSHQKTLYTTMYITILYRLPPYIDISASVPLGKHQCGRNIFFL